ncbi:MobF family relaxase [Mycobacteroides abscessus]|uniref:MobF family relaxase n=9 Tax=Mycobacteroides abscessus TaxID=36809 RepID=UPI000940ABC7|nr:MobF family relaxase [Mycobacteroides abscessus]
MTATCHKLTAGDGYEYLTRQVAAHDSTEKGRMSLADYYHAKGEAPGRWIGSGLKHLSEPAGRSLTDEERQDWTVAEGSEVTAEQMKALFGLGQHPNAEQIATKAVAAGVHPDVAKKIPQLGRPFPIYTKASEYRKACAEAFGAHNESVGRAAAAALDDDVRAHIRSEVARGMFAQQHGRQPDALELTTFIAEHSRPATIAVSGHDWCASPVKSVSTLWAVCGTRERQLIELAQDLAGQGAIRSMERNSLFTRMGAQGVQQLDATGFIGTAFTHRQSRANNPDLHTHYALSAKCRAIGPDGVPRWLAMDGRPFYKSLVAMSETYNSLLEAYLIEFLGVQFVERPTEPGKRPIREIAGISPELMEFWSQRAKMIDDRLAELTIKFQQEVGREPTASEAYDLSQRATLETRQAKMEPQSFAEQRETWHREAVEVLGSEKALAEMLTNTLGRQQHRTQEPVSAEWLDDKATQLLATVAESRAKWQWAHVHAEAWRIARAEGVAHQPDIAERLTNTALGRSIRVASTALDGELNEPDFLRRRNGESVYTTHGTDMYTSADIVAAERRIVAAAAERGARRLDADSIDMALLEHAANNDFALNADQAALVRALGSSTAGVRLALAPAGTGKTTAMSVLSHAWADSGGTVLGLAPTAAAAEILGAEIGTAADTLAKYVHCTTHPEQPVPAWFDRLDHNSLILVDEAGMAATLDLDALIAHARGRGATVVLIGDDQQLASISAGGVLRDIAHVCGATTLTTVVRFADPAESAASLALRQADPAALGFYLDNERVHIGSDAAAADMAYTAWRADIDEGIDSIMLAPTTSTVTELNQRAQADRIARTGRRGGRASSLRDGTRAHVGDVVFTRKNDRRLTISGTDYVRNRYRWTVRDVHRDGSLTVQQITKSTKPGRIVRLPSSYTSRHVTLGYAATVHAAQGLTTMRCHLIGAASLTRQLLYVAMTRGKLGNHIYFSTAEHDPHKIISRSALLPETAVEILTKILARDGSQHSATSAQRDAQNPFLRLAAAAGYYSDAVESCAEHQLGADIMAAIDQGADELYPQLTEADAWPALRKHLALRALPDQDAKTALDVLAAAITRRELDTADDPAAVLHWRIQQRTGAQGPLPWLTAIPAELQQHPDTAIYLHARFSRVRDLAEEVHTAALAWTSDTAPRWAQALHAADPVLTARIAVFRAACGIDDADQRLTGPDQYAVTLRSHQAVLMEAGAAALPSLDARRSRWTDAVRHLDPRLPDDPYWTQLTHLLDDIERDGFDVSQILAAAATKPLPADMPAAALWWRAMRAIHGDTRPSSAAPAELLELWTREKNLTDQLAELETAQADPTHWGTPHLAAFKDRYGQLLSEYRRQEPHHRAVTDAYQHWLDADRELTAANRTTDRENPADTDDRRARAAVAEQAARDALHHAQQEREHALGGAQPVTDTMLTELVDEALRADRRLLEDTRNRLQRAKTQARSAEQQAAIEAVKDTGRTSRGEEDDLTQIRLAYTLLEDAAHTHARTPRPSIDQSGLNADQIAVARELARSPYTLNVLTGTPEDTRAVLDSIRAGAARQQRTVHDITAADTIGADDMLDAIVLVSDADRWELPALHRLAETARREHAKLILAGDPQTASATPHFRALPTELPWTQAAPEQRQAATPEVVLASTPQEATTSAIQAAQHDQAAGVDAVILAAGPQQADALNTAAHERSGAARDRVAIGWHHLGVGDIITTTALTETAEGTAVAPGGRWTITELNQDAATAKAIRRDDPSVTITVDEHTPYELGYAQTARTYAAGPAADRIHLPTDEHTTGADLHTSRHTDTTLYVAATSAEEAADVIAATHARDTRPRLILDTKADAAQRKIDNSEEVSQIDKLALQLVDKRAQLKDAATEHYRQWTARQQRAAQARQRANERSRSNDGHGLSL